MEPHRKANAFRDIGVNADPKLLDAISRRAPNVAGGGLTHVPGGTIIIPDKVRRNSVPVVVCPFGQIITYTEAGTSKRGIRGGIIHCGDKNLEIPTQFTNPDVAGEWLVFIELTCKANRDDGNKIFLPGMLTATAPTGTWGRTVWSATASYPDNTPLVVGTGNGKIILPMGRLKISDTGDISLIQSGCGNFTVTQCAGTLAYIRA